VEERAFAVPGSGYEEEKPRRRKCRVGEAVATARRKGVRVWQPSAFDSGASASWSPSVLTMDTDPLVES
jgi:hypothetical protein